MELRGHEVMSREALDAFASQLPPNLRWLRGFLDDTVHHTMNRDVLDVVTGGHWSDVGQRHHFMRAPGQTDHQAYVLAVQWIHDNALEAAGSLRRLWELKSTRNFNSGFVTGPLGYAFHALQDSYSGAHVTRINIGGELHITRIHVYDDSNTSPHGSWPGHEALDKRWKGDLGKEAITACRELTKIAVVSSFEKPDVQFRQRWASLWTTFTDLFLKARLGKAPPH